MLSEIRQTQKEEHCTISLVESEKVDLAEAEDRRVVPQGRVEGERGDGAKFRSYMINEAWRPPTSTVPGVNNTCI